MCYKWPGPRCSPHARIKLERALASGDTKRIEAAKAEWNLTPAGIDELRQKGRVGEADAAKRERRNMIHRANEDAEIMTVILYQMQEFEGDNYHTLTLKLVDHYRRKYGTPWVGRTRAVFDRGDGYVIKVPLNGEGFLSNSREVNSYGMEDPYIPTAECWEETDHSVNKDGLSVLIMEKVKVTFANYKDMPDWVGSVDCGQVGYNRKGELVAYDL